MPRIYADPLLIAQQVRSAVGCHCAEDFQRPPFPEYYKPKWNDRARSGMSPIDSGRQDESASDTH